MPITLIRSNKDNIIHGADNDRKTGCGIRLQGNSGYSREGEMTDITDLKCERCKEVFATKLIRESNREELKLAREERKRFAREKKQGTITESTYEEYVLKRESEASSKRDSKTPKNTSELPPLKADMPDNTSSNQYQQSSYAQPTVEYPGYQQSVQSALQYNNNSTSQNQTYQSQQAELKSSNAPEIKKTSAVDDDFLSQFIVKKETIPQESAPVSKQQSFNAASNIISAADEILSQFEIDTEYDTSSVSAPITGDASSFYSNQIPLVEAEYVSSHDINSIPNSEFGSVSVEKSQDIIDDFVVPEVPELTPVYQPYTNESVSSQTLFTDQLSSVKAQSFNSSFDSIEVPDISDMNSVPLSQPTYQQSTSLQFDSLDIHSPVNHFTQPQVSQPLPAASIVNEFADIGSIQSQDNNPPFVSPVQAPVSEFVSIVPPANEFISAVPPVISNVQSTADEFTAVSSASGFNMPNKFIVPPSMQQDTVPAAPYTSYQQQTLYGNSGSLQNTYTSTPVESQSDVSQFNNSFSQNYNSAVQSYNNVNNGSFSNQFKNSNTFSNADISQLNNASSGNAPVLNKEDQIKKKPIPVLFNPQNNTPMVDSIEEALRQLGAAGGSAEEKNKASEKEDIVPDYVPYVPSSSKSLYSTPPVNTYNNQSKRVVSPKDAKKLAKIDAKFHKELAERGFNAVEFKSQRRGK